MRNNNTSCKHSHHCPIGRTTTVTSDGRVPCGSGYQKVSKVHNPGFETGDDSFWVVSSLYDWYVNPHPNCYSLSGRAGGNHSMVSLPLKLSMCVYWLKPVYIRRRHTTRKYWDLCRRRIYHLSICEHTYGWCWEAIYMLGRLLFTKGRYQGFPSWLATLHSWGGCSALSIRPKRWELGLNTEGELLLYKLMMLKSEEWIRGVDVCKIDGTLSWEPDYDVGEISMSQSE